MTPVASAGNANATLDAEATIYENQPGFNGGGDTQVCVGTNGIAGTARRALVRYAMPGIPIGAVIKQVNLTLRQVRVRSNGLGPVSATVSVHRVLQTWEEGTGSGPGNGPCGGGSNVTGVDWDGMPDVETLPSAQFGFSASAPQQLMVMDDDATTVQLMEDVSAWIGGADNHGWLLKINNEAAVDSARVVEPLALTVIWDDPPNAAVSGNDRPVANGDTSPSGINGTFFGAIPPGSGFRDQTFRITNTGEQDLLLDMPTPVSLMESTTCLPGWASTCEER